MEWSLDSFFKEGGTTKFVDRLAGSLGIHASTIKIVSVYEGSVVLNYAITTVNDDKAALEAINQKQTEKFATGKMDLGAPILDVASVTTSTTVESVPARAKPIISGGVVSASGYAPIVITKTASNQGGSASTFIPNIPILHVNKTIYE